MKTTLRALLALALAALAVPAFGQTLSQNLPANTLVGRLGAGTSGPAQAIPFTSPALAQGIFTRTQDLAGSYVEFRKTNTPTNFGTTRAHIIAQMVDTKPASNLEVIPGWEFVYTWSGDGHVTVSPNASYSVFAGLWVVGTKTGDGSGQNFTCTGQLGAVGAVGYNEQGCFQGEITNIGSTNGHMSFIEGYVADGTSGTNFATSMDWGSHRIAKYNAASTATFINLSPEGTQPINSIMQKDANAPGTMITGLDLHSFTFTSGVWATVPNNTCFNQLNSLASSFNLLCVDAADNTDLSYGKSTGSIQLKDASGNIFVKAENYNDIFTITGGTLSSQKSVLSITATQPASPAGQTNGMLFVITGAGNASQINRAMQITYGAGYTGSSNTVAINTVNANAGTGTTVIPTANTNVFVINNGIAANANATTTGYNVGAAGLAEGGVANFGVLGLAQVPKDNGTNIGVTGSAVNTGASPVMVGGWFTLNRTTIPVVSAALIADNDSQAQPVARFKVNGVDQVVIDVTGNLNPTNNIVMQTAAKTLVLKQGANGSAGTFICTSGGAITVTNSNVAITDTIIISLNTAGGTISTAPALNAITANTSFVAKCATNDTATYNYAIIKNAA